MSDDFQQWNLLMTAFDLKNKVIWLSSMYKNFVYIIYLICSFLLLDFLLGQKTIEIIVEVKKRDIPSPTSYIEDHQIYHH